MHPNLQKIEDALSRATFPEVRSFLSYMKRIHPKSRLPKREEFEPFELRKIMTNLVVVEVIREGSKDIPRFFVRVVGERVASAAPSVMMNRFLDEAVADGVGSIVIDVRRTVVDTGLTYFWSGAPRMKFKLDFVDTVEYAHCPFAEDGVSVDRIISAFSYGKQGKSV
jgi:hypothetical protein